MRLAALALGLALGGCPSGSRPCGEEDASAERCAARPGAAARCEAASCAWACLPGRLDCDGDLGLPGGNGCEVDASSDAAHCGACGRACGALPGVASRCVEGSCAFACAEGRGDCDGDLAGPGSNGCETPVSSSALHCGECFHPCETSCSAGLCSGETPRCALFADVATRPTTTALATDGARFALVFNDFVGGGLWLAGVDARARPATTPRRLASVRSHDRFAVAWDGASFVVAWTDTLNGPWVWLQRFTGPQLSPVASAERLVLPAMPWGLALSGRAGALLLWTVTSSDGRENQVALLTPAPAFRAVTLADTANHVLGLAGVPGGWLALYPAEDGDAGVRAPRVQVLEADGTPRGAPLSLPFDAAAPLTPRLCTLGDAALLLGVADAGTAALALDADGGAAGGVERVDPPATLGLGLAGHGTGATALLVSGTPTALAAWVRPLDARGAPRGPATLVATLPSMRGASLAATEVGTLVAWVRPRFGVEEAAVEVAFVDGAGAVWRACP